MRQPLVLKLEQYLFFFLLSCCPLIAAGQTDNKALGLQVVLEATQPDDMTISFTLRNTSKAEMRILKWSTPLDGGFNGDNFTVDYESGSTFVPVEYLDRHVKRAPQAENDFITLKSGESVVNGINISHGYATFKSGLYSVKYQSSLQVYVAASENANSSQSTTPSEFDGWTPLIAAIESNSVTLIQSVDFSTLQSKVAPQFNSCSAPQQSTIDEALTEAENMSSLAAAALNTTTVDQRAAATRYTTWFGSYLSSRYTSVTSQFNAILDAAADKQLDFVCGSSRCGQGTFAFVYSNSPYEIYLCDAFWDAPMIGTDSKAGTIVHELSHFSVVADTDDHQYGQASAKQLAVSNPNLAINNADSHEYFAENTPPLNMSGGDVPPAQPPNNESQILSLGIPIESAIDAGQWAYFEVQGASEITLYGLSADLDLYIGNGAQPNTVNFQCRPFSGGTVSETCSVSPAETTFIGVNAFASGSFSLIATATISTPDNGSGSEEQELSVDIPVSGSLVEDSWDYYTVTGAAEIRLFNLSTDLDLYIGNGGVPTLSDYQCRPFSIGTNEERCAIDPEGITYIGVNAFFAGSYNLVANSEVTVVQGAELSLNVPVSAELSPGEWDFFEVNGASEVRLFALDADVDLYIGNGQAPTLSDYQCRPFSFGTQEEVCLVDPNTTTYIGINAFLGGSYSVVASGEVTDSDGDNQALVLGEPVSGTLSSGSWDYYDVTDATEVTLYNLSADLDLYVSSQGNPTLTSYTCRPFLPGDNLEFCTITTRGTVTIGVNSFDSGSYSLLAINSANSDLEESVTVELNQAAYRAGDPLVVTMTIAGDLNLDSYVGIVVPSGDFFTVSPSSGLSQANSIVAYHSNLQVNGEQTHTIFNTTLPAGVGSGVYQACGLLVEAGLSAASENWIDSFCVSFTVSENKNQILSEKQSRVKTAIAK